MVSSNPLDTPDDEDVASTSSFIGDIENLPSSHPSRPAAVADVFLDSATRSWAGDVSCQSQGGGMQPFSPLSAQTQRSCLSTRRKLFLPAVVLLVVCALTYMTLFLTQSLGVTTFFQSNNANVSGGDAVFIPIEIQQQIDAEISAMMNGASNENLLTIPTVSPSMTSAPTDTPTYTSTLLIDSMMFKPEADTFVEVDVKTPEGGSTKIRVDGSPEKIALFRFDTTPMVDTGVKVIRAHLHLYSLSNSPFGGKVDLLDDCDEWREDELSWRNAPNCVFDDDAETLGSFGAIVPFMWNTVNLTLASDLLSKSSVTLRLSTDLEDGVMYGSRQNETACPELIFDFHRTAEPTSSPTTESPTSASPTSSTIAPILTPYPTSDWPTFAPAEMET